MKVYVVAPEPEFAAKVEAAGGIPVDRVPPQAVTLTNAGPAATAPKGDITTVLAKVTQLVAEKTGYPTDLLDPDLDMEADLGIDTVKQAELFGTLRETFGVPRDDALQLKDFPTLRKVAEYMTRGSTKGAPTAAPAPHAAPKPAPAQVQKQSEQSPRSSALSAASAHSASTPV